MNTITPTLNARELATVLAALSLRQADLAGVAGSPVTRGGVDQIATDSGEYDALGVGDIEALCLRLNTSEPAGGPCPHPLYLRSYNGKFIRVTALFADDSTANGYMRDNDGQSLLALVNGIALLADKDDLGVTEAAVLATATPTVVVAQPLPTNFIGDVLCTMIESGYGWFEWRDEVLNKDGTDYLAATAVEIDETDQSAPDGKSRRIDGAAIAEAINKILSGQVQISGDLVDALRNAVAELDAGHLDADCADCIAQVAVFGELVYG